MADQAQPPPVIDLCASTMSSEAHADNATTVEVTSIGRESETAGRYVLEHAEVWAPYPDPKRSACDPVLSGLQCQASVTLDHFCSFLSPAGSGHTTLTISLRFQAAGSSRPIIPSPGLQL